MYVFRIEIINPTLGLERKFNVKVKKTYNVPKDHVEPVINKRGLSYVRVGRDFNDFQTVERILRDYFSRVYPPPEWYIRKIELNLL